MKIYRMLFALKGLFASLVIIILASVLLNGCGTTAAMRQAMSMMTKSREINQILLPCKEKIGNNPAYEPIYSHAPRIGEEPTITQLTDTAIPTIEEVNILIAIHNDKAPCVGKAIERMIEIAPRLGPIFIEGQRAADFIYANLVERKSTWGEANNKNKKNRDEVNRKSKYEINLMMQELKSSHEEELANREAAKQTGLAVLQAVSEVLLAWSQQQQALANRLQSQQVIIRPAITNCQVIGNTVNCMTY